MKKITGAEIKRLYKIAFESTTSLLKRLEVPAAELCAKNLVRLFKTSTHKKLTEHPHYLTLVGAPYTAAEEMAAKIDGGQYDPVRIQALCRLAYKAATQGGSTRIKIEELYEKVCRLEERAGYFKKTPPVMLGPELAEHYVYEDGFVYGKYLADEEKEIAENIAFVRSYSYGKKIPAATIEAIEQMLGVTYDATQREAFSLLESGIGILTGGPGTGKTTTINGLLAAYEAEIDGPITLAAPTGRAAKRMEELTGRPAATLHKTLGIYPYMEGGYQHSVDLPTGGLFVIDESSMIDTDLMSVLMRAAAAAHSQVLFVGDEDQLPSVGAGNVLHDLLDCGKIPVVRLGQIHRQDGGSAIVENSQRIKRGELGLVHDDSFLSKQYYDTREMVSCALALHKKYYTGPGSVQIYTPVRDPSYDTSTYTINLSLHKLYHDGEPETQIAGQLFSVGDPIVITHNFDSLVNGDIGTVTSIEDGLRVEIEGQEYQLSGKMLQYVELAYAVTVHKGQGCQTPIAIVIVPSKPRCMLTRRLLYVAVTRAEKKCYLLHDGDGLFEALRNYNETPRNTGLKERLSHV